MSIDCKQCQNSFDELLDGVLPEGDRRDCMQHIKDCSDCRELYAHELNLRHELSTLPVPPMRSAFVDQALQRVRREHQRSKVTQHRGFVAGAGSAIAAGIALWFSVTLFSPQDVTTEPLQAISLSVGQVQQVNLVFDSPEFMKQATFTLTLPDSAELEGYPGKRELRWTVSLHKGKNRLSLPLRVDSESPGEIVARISNGQREKVFRLKLKVKSLRSDLTRFEQV